MQESRISSYWKQIKNQIYGSDDFLISWDNFQKGKLVLLFCLTVQLFSTFWYLVCYFNPATKEWLNLDFFKPRMIALTFCILINILAIWSAQRFGSSAKFRKVIEVFAPNFFGITMAYSSYTLGVYNPVTMAGLINLILLGLVFYERKILYSIALPVAAYIIILCFLSSAGYVRYAPVFTDELNHSVLYKNWFWVSSVLVIYLPILFLSVLMFEVLLSQWRKRESNTDQLSKLDALTSVFNRRFIGSYITQLKDRQYALILLDLDYFKKINDSYGHDVGDHVLCRVAKVLADNVRGNDIVGRYGGEEFILILQGKSLQQAHLIAERCRRQIESEEFTIHEDLKLSVSASFGIALSSKDLTQEQVIKRADQALYLAKEKGRNRVQTFK